MVICPVEDEDPPVIEIVKPEVAIYLFNTKLFRFLFPVIIGAIDIELSASDDGTGIKKVELYINEVLQTTFNATPYKWHWDQFAFGARIIKAKAYDYMGNMAEAELSVAKFF